MIISPAAMAVDEKTPMTVSVEVRLRFLMYIMKSAKRTENTPSETSGDTIPKIAPKAMPVNAPCPKESEKNTIRLDTTIVERNPVAHDRDGSLARQWGDVRATPTAFVLDRKGRIARRFVGSQLHEVSRLIGKLLSEG